MKYLIYFRGNDYILHYGEILEQGPVRAKIRTPDGTEYYCDYTFICPTKKDAAKAITLQNKVIMESKLRKLEGL